MSPQTALTSLVFQFYGALAAGLLLGAGLVLAILRWGFRKDVAHAWKAYCGWLLMVPLLFAAMTWSQVWSMSLPATQLIVSHSPGMEAVLTCPSHLHMSAQRFMGPLSRASIHTPCGFSHHHAPFL